MTWQVITWNLIYNKLEDESNENLKGFISEWGNKLRMENNVRLLAALTYLNH